MNRYGSAIRSPLAKLVVIGLFLAVVILALPIVRAAAAVPQWKTVVSPTLTETLKTNIAGIGCSGSNFCIAVGGYTASGGLAGTLVEQWNGSRWSIQPSPNSSKNNSVLGGVNCPSTTFCMAVGAARNCCDVALAEMWNGTNWTVQSPPLGSGVGLGQVSCIGSTFCMAIGGGGNSGGAFTVAAEWNGHAWSGIGMPSNSNDDYQLYGLSCVTSTFCMADGYYDNATSPYTRQTLIEQWNGNVWTIVPSPNTGPTDNNQLTGMKCLNETLCFADGAAVTGSTSQTLLEDWNGSGWSIDGSVAEAGTLGSISCASAAFCLAIGTVSEEWNGKGWSGVGSPSNVAELSGIRCTSATFCLAVGGQLTAASAMWSGGVWTQISMPSKRGAMSMTLSAVSCVSTSFCMAVGSDSVGGLIEKWSGTSWIVETSPKGSSFYLTSIRCTSTTFCMAVGFSFDGSKDQTLAEQWNGTTWALVPSANMSSPPNNVLSGINCASPTFCMAVGYAADSTFAGTQTLIEDWNGVAWAITNSQNVAGVPYNSLSSVACSSTAFCMAVGGSSSSSPNTGQTLAEQWNGVAWAIVSAYDGAYSNTLNGVACVGTAFCVAVGTGDSGYQSLIEEWTGSTWSLVPSPQGNFYDASSVKCTTSAFCMAVGSTVTSSSSYATFAEDWNGTNWLTTPTPDIGTKGSVLSGLSCIGMSFCMAVGYTVGAGDTDAALIERWS